MRRTLVALAFGMAAMAVSTSGHADVLDQIKARKTLRVAVPQDFPAYETRNVRRARRRTWAPLIGGGTEVLAVTEHCNV